MEAIRQFPRPKNITGLRAWFGLVEHVSFAFSKTKEMELFWEPLKKDRDFAWCAELQSALKHTHQSIADKVVAGVKTFVLGRPTAVVAN